MINTDQFLEENIDTSYDASFKDGFTEALKAKGDADKETIIHYPWVGADYKIQPIKILIILESSYLNRNETDCSITGGVTSLCDKTYARRILTQAAIWGNECPEKGGYYSRTHANLNILLTGHKDTKVTARINLWRTLAFYNFVTCPLDWSRKIKQPKTMSDAEFQKRKDEIDNKITKGSRDGFHKLQVCFPDFKERVETVYKKDIVKSNDIEVFKKVFGILQPNVCIIASSRVWGAVGREIVEISTANNFTCVFTPHPSCPGFSSNKERDKLPEEVKNILSKI